MANYTEIFFSPSGRSKDTVLSDISETTGAEFYSSNEPYADYQAHLNEINYDFKYGHDYENDLGIPFETMPYILTIRGYRNEREKEEQIAKTIFEQLAQKNYRPIYIVREVSKTLASRD